MRLLTLGCHSMWSKSNMPCLLDSVNILKMSTTYSDVGSSGLMSSSNGPRVSVIMAVTSALAALPKTSLTSHMPRRTRVPLTSITWVLVRFNNEATCRRSSEIGSLWQIITGISCWPDMRITRMQIPTCGVCDISASCPRSHGAPQQLCLL